MRGTLKGRHLALKRVRQPCTCDRIGSRDLDRIEHGTPLDEPMLPAAARSSGDERITVSDAATKQPVREGIRRHARPGFALHRLMTRCADLETAGE
jgi:hypothetical protein